jgi:hypothetical protein
VTKAAPLVRCVPGGGRQAFCDFVSIPAFRLPICAQDPRARVLDTVNDKSRQTPGRARDGTRGPG